MGGDKTGAVGILPIHFDYSDLEPFCMQGPYSLAMGLVHVQVRF